MKSGIRSHLVRVLLCVAIPAFAQEPRSYKLTVPDARLATGFSDVSGVRELPDGRVLVLDMADHGLAMVDRTFTAVTPVGRQGSGPGEYLRATKLFSMPNGAAVLDWGNSRLLEIDASGRPGGTQPANARCPTLPRRYPLFAAVDQEGRFYSEDAFDARPGADSTAIIRWNSPCAGDTLAFNRKRMAPAVAVPFWVADQWAVALDGRVALLHHDPYRVTIIRPDRSRIVGPLIEYPRIRVNDQVKEAWRKEQQRPMGVMTVTRSGTVSGGVMKKPYVEPKDWPAALPPFLRDAASFDSDGRLWVHRTVAPGERPRYDVIDTTGRLRAAVQLRPASRVVGFGPGTVYIVQRDDDDLEFLERHRIRIG